MAYTFHELREKNVAELREVAAGIEHDAVKGYTQLHKDQLLKAICTALNLDMHEHHEVKGINKAAIKAKIKAMKQKRAEAIAAHDRAQLKLVHRSIHRLKRQIHKATV